MPLLLIMIMTKFFGENKKWMEVLLQFYHLLFLHLVFHDSLFNYTILGPEFPSIVGGLFGMAIVTIAVKLNF